MKRKLFLSLLVLGLPLILGAQTTDKTIKHVAPVKKVLFNASKRNPFLSKEEIFKIEAMKREEQLRLETQRQEEIRRLEEARIKALREQLKHEEMLRHPSREVSDKIKVDGILGNDAIVNGQLVSIGNKVLGAKVISVTDSSVWFVYKGERFQVKLPLM